MVLAWFLLSGKSSWDVSENLLSVPWVHLVWFMHLSSEGLAAGQVAAAVCVMWTVVAMMSADCCNFE